MYDFSRPTCEMYRSETQELRPRYKEARKILDYTWHSYYTLERQKFQDSLVDQVSLGVGCVGTRVEWCSVTNRSALEYVFLGQIPKTIMKCPINNL